MTKAVVYTCPSNVSPTSISHWDLRVCEQGVKLYLVPEGSAACASPLLPAMTDVKEDVWLQERLLVEYGIRCLAHRLPA